MFSLPRFFTTALVLGSALSSPVQELDTRNLTPAQCSKVVTVVKILKLHKATPFCSSFVSIKPATATITALVTVTESVTNTATVTSGTASTSVVFKPGNPPNPSAKAKRAVEEKRATAPAIPYFLKTYASSAISTGCSCLNLPTPTNTITIPSTSTLTATVQTTVTVSPPVITSTVYPCATPVPSLIPTIPFGIANQQGIFETQNNRYPLDSTEGASLEGCCNLCYFGLPDCVQAWWYSYQGCVVQQAISIEGTGQGISEVCPSGKISALRYGPDTSPPFRSTGSIAGPCGVEYNNL